MSGGSLDTGRGRPYTAGMKRMILPLLALFVAGAFMTGCDDKKDEKTDEAAAEQAK